MEFEKLHCSFVVLQMTKRMVSNGNSHLSDLNVVVKNVRCGMKIGMIGLGAMGLPMAQNLVNAGMVVYGYDVSEKQREAFYQSGGIACDTLQEAVKDVEVVLTSLPNSSIVESIMLAEDGVLKQCKSGCCIVDMSSVGPATSRKIYEIAKEYGIRYADAPVSGGVGGATNGTLTIMFGGEKETWEKVQPVLEILGKKLVYVGEIGSGDAIKLVNNLMLGCNMAAIAEALTLGKQLGLSLETMRDIISSSSGNSYAFTAKMEKFIIPGQFEGGFATDLQYKDLNLALEAGKETLVPLPMTAAATQVFEASRSMGNGKKDMSSAVLVWERLMEL